MKVLTCNIHKGFCILNRRFVLPFLKRALAESAPDLVFLQEVMGHQTGMKNHIKDEDFNSQIDYLRTEIWPHFVYGQNAFHKDGHYGNAILSKFPLEFCENIDISNNRFEKRGLLHAVVKGTKGGENLHLLCVHLDLLERGRQVQAQRICQRIEESVPPTAPFILAGDFNDWRMRLGSTLSRRFGTQEVHKTLHGAYGKSFPSRFPVLPLDRIYFRGGVPLRAQVLSGEPWIKLSDHLPLLAELVF